MSSRNSVASMQRVNAYRPDGAIAAHVLAATVSIDSSEQVIFEDGRFLVQSSKFVGRFYTCRLVKGVWTCSAQDASVAARCIAQAKAFRQSW